MEEEIKIELLASSFWEKIKVNKFKVLGGILVVLIFAGAVFGVYKLGQKQIQPTPQPTPTLMVTPIPTPTPSIIVTPIVTPTPDPTANWKTYTNTKYRYQFKYPPARKFKISLTNPESSPLYVIRETVSSGYVDGWDVLIRAYENSDELSLVDWLRFKRDSESLTLPADDVELVPNFMVTGVPAFKIWDDPFSKGREPGRCIQACPILDIYFTYKDKAYCVQLNYTREVDAGSQETFLQILSTFRFLE